MEREIKQDLKIQGEKLENISAEIPRIKEEIEEVLVVQDERMKRFYNLVIFNIPEPEGQESNKRQEEDHNVVMNLLEELNIPACPINPVIRLGRFAPHRTRPIRISVYNEQTRQNIMRAGKALNTNPLPEGHRINGVKFFPDRTIFERERYKSKMNRIKTQHEYENSALERKTPGDGLTTSLRGQQNKYGSRTFNNNNRKGAGNERPPKERTGEQETTLTKSRKNDKEENCGSFQVEHTHRETSSATGNVEVSQKPSA